MISDSVRSLYRESRISREAAHLYTGLVSDYLNSAGTVSTWGEPELLEELAREDWIALDEDGRISVLYPFALDISGILVDVEGVPAHAMCAIDALGISAMLACPVSVDATCPESGERLKINVTEDGGVFSTPSSVVVLRRRQSGAAHLNRCEATRFFKSAQDAESWREKRGNTSDVVLSLDDALDEATAIFGQALSGVRLVL